MKTVDISLDGLSVVVAIPAGRDFHPLTVKSLLGTFTLAQQVGMPCQLGMIVGSSVIQWARDEVIDLFLKSDASRLFWIDSDMIWEPSDFMRMMALSQVYDVVAAPYTAKHDQPTFYVHREPGDMVANEHGLFEIWGTGLGFTVMRREVVEKLVSGLNRLHDDIADRDMAEVFRVGAAYENGRRVRRGEDIAFFHDIRGLGYKVWMDPLVKLGHVGTKVYTGSIMDAISN